MGAEGGEVLQDEVIKTVHLKQVPEAIEESIFVHEVSLLIDPTEQASRFLRSTSWVLSLDTNPQHCSKDYLQRALIGALRYGRTLTLKFTSLEEADKDKLFGDPDMFPEAVLSRQEFYKPEVWENVIKNEEEKMT